jgi:hypothetical protein
MEKIYLLNQGIMIAQNNRVGVRGTNGGNSVVSAAICAAGQPLFPSVSFIPAEYHDLLL